MKSEYEINHEAMKKWNERRGVSEAAGLDKFRRLSADPILHPSKNLSASSEKLSISVLLESKLKNKIDPISAGIKIALKRNDINRCFEMVKMFNEDNPRMIKEIIGEDLLNRIINL